MFRNKLYFDSTYRVFLVMRTVFKKMAGVFLLVFLFNGLTNGYIYGEKNDAIPLEYHVKAAYIFKFVQYVSGPMVEKPDDIVIIGILDDKPTGRILFQALLPVNGKVINGKKIIVTHFQNLEQVESCHILFISQSSKTDVQVALRHAREMRALTIGESENFLALGGIINLIKVGGTIRYEINTQAAKATGFKIDTKLLRLATVRRNHAS